MYGHVMNFFLLSLVTLGYFFFLLFCLSTIMVNKDEYIMTNCHENT